MLEGPSPSAKVGGKIEVARFATSGGTGGTARLGIAKGAVDLKELAAPEKRKKIGTFSVKLILVLGSLDTYLYFFVKSQRSQKFVWPLSLGVKPFNP